MKVYISKFHYPVSTLGFGSRRLGIWFQGCTIRCPGCINRDTWEFDEGHATDTDEVRRVVEKFRHRRVDGVTITGGEPFDQPGALAEIIGFCRQVTDGDILAYSGHSYAQLKREHAKILEKIDVLVSEPFVESDPDRLIWRGSDNQRIRLLSKKARGIYPANINKIEYSGRRMQYSMIGGRIFTIGIPARRDIGKLLELMKDKGVYCDPL